MSPNPENVRGVVSQSFPTYMIEQEPIVLRKTQDFLCFHHSKIRTTITAEEECFEKGLISSQNKQTSRIN